MKPLSFSAAALALLLAAPAIAQDKEDPRASGFHSGGGHFADGHHNWAPHPGWHGDIHHFDINYWRGGHWWHGPYFGVVGWWWIVGPDWYWYADPIYPYPEPYVPAGSATGFLYYCDAYQQYYPYVGACPSGWRAVPPDAPPAAPGVPAPQK